MFSCFQIANKRVSEYAASERLVSNNSLPPSKFDIRRGKLFRLVGALIPFVFIMGLILQEPVCASEKCEMDDSIWPMGIKQKDCANDNRIVLIAATMFNVSL